MNVSKQSLAPTTPAPPPTDDQAGPSDQASGGARQLPSSRDRLAEIGRLIRGEEPAQDDAQGAQDDAGDQAGQVGGKPGERAARGARRSPPKSLDDAAKALGIDVAALYELEVPLRAGDAKSAKKLGELKDYFAGQDDHRLDRLAWDEQRNREQASIARERAEVAEILQAIPTDKLNPEIVDRVRKRIDQVLVGERRKTLERIPEWQDEATRTADLAGIAEHLADYGFPVHTLQGISDSRMLAYMRENYLRMKRLNEALERVQAVRPAATPKRGKAAERAPIKSPVRPQAGARTLDHQVDAISKLLRG